MALAKGKSAIRVGPQVTDHTEGSLYVLRKFIPDLKIRLTEEKNEGASSWTIEIEGFRLVYLLEYKKS